MLAPRPRASATPALRPLNAALSSALASKPQVIVREKPRQWYHFLTTTCAIIGGVFTVAGILDALL